MMYRISYLLLTPVGTPETKPCIHILFNMKRKKNVLYVAIYQPGEMSIQDGPYMSSSKVSKRIQIRTAPELTYLIPSSQLKKPSLRSSSRSLYIQAVPQLEESTRPNLEMPLNSLLDDGDEVVVTDTKLPFELRFVIRFQPLA